MTPFSIVMPGEVSSHLFHAVEEIINCFGQPEKMVTSTESIPDLRGQKILFAVQLDQVGSNSSLMEIFSYLFQRGNDALLGSTGAIIIVSPNDFYTKSASQMIIFLANLLGCRFLGHPLVEATAGFINLRNWEKVMRKPQEKVFLALCRNEAYSLLIDNPVNLGKPKILGLHASSRKTSNTVMLWDMVKEHLDSSRCTVDELNVEKGIVMDCRGCSFKQCLHYSQQDSCFYGGVVVKEILPAIGKADALVWICPNYNDAISANLMAVINRMTALYRKTAFYQKTIFTIIVSGNSGSDSVAKQLIGALNINKGFRLPPYFALTATASEPGEIRQVPQIEEKARHFAGNLLKEIKA